MSRPTQKTGTSHGVPVMASVPSTATGETELGDPWVQVSKESGGGAGEGGGYCVLADRGQTQTPGTVAQESGGGGGWPGRVHCPGCALSRTNITTSDPPHTTHKQPSLHPNQPTNHQHIDYRNLPWDHLRRLHGIAMVTESTTNRVHV